MNLSVNLSNPFVIIFIAGSLISFFINQILELIDYKYRIKNGGKLPSQLQNIPAAIDTFDTEKLKNIGAYENAKYFDMIPSSLCSIILSIALILFGFYPAVFNLVSNWTGFPSTVTNSFCCFFLFSILSSIPGEVVSLPFSLYREFHTEKKFGFSKMTLKLWIIDQIKETILSLILITFLTFAASLFFVKCPDTWWIILTTVMIGFTFIFQIIYPKFIAPLFNKFEPLPEGELKNKISVILNKCGFSNGGLFVMDASKRSGHSNAYFSGFGKAKRIVLYDTLIKSLTTDELCSVLGHELGHFKLHHITKKLFFTIPMEFIVMFLLYKLAQFTSLYEGFGFTGINNGNVAQVQFIGLFLAVSVSGAILDIISPVVNFFSRKDEYAADAFSAKICEDNGENLITGLIKLNSDNLSELLPPPVYVFWNYSHPTLIERITAIRKLFTEAK